MFVRKENINVYCIFLNEEYVIVSGNFNFIAARF